MYEGIEDALRNDELSAWGGNLLLSKNAAVFNHLSTLHSKRPPPGGFLAVSTCDVRSTSTMIPCWMSIGLAVSVMAYSYSSKVVVAKIFDFLTPRIRENSRNIFFEMGT